MRARRVQRVYLGQAAAAKPEPQDYGNKWTTHAPKMFKSPPHTLLLDRRRQLDGLLVQAPDASAA